MDKKKTARKVNTLAMKKTGITLPVVENISKMPNDYENFINDLKKHVNRFMGLRSTTLYNGK